MEGDCHCKSCKWWNREGTQEYVGWRSNDIIPDYPFHECNNRNFVYGPQVDPSQVPSDALIYWDGEWYGAGVVTGPDFGCIHYEGEQK